MSGPNSVIARRDLFDLAKEFDVAGNAAGYVGLSIMPMFSTSLQSGAFPKMNKEDLMKNADDSRSPRGGYNRIDFGFDQDTFSCVERGLEGPVDETLAENYDSYLDAEIEMQNILLGHQAKNREIRIRDIVYAESGNAVGTAWSTAATCTPREDVKDAIATVRDRTGVAPNGLTITWAKFQEILVCEEFLGSAKFTANPLTMAFEAQVALVSAFLGVDLKISSGIQNTADEGQDFSGSSIWDDTKGFLWIGGSSLQGGPKYGLTMNWSNDSLVGTESYEEEQTRSNIIRVRSHEDHKIVLSEAGYLFTGL